MTDIKQVPFELELSRDSRDSFRLFVVDERDLAEDLSQYDDALLEIKADKDGAALVTRQVTGPANLTFNTTDGTLDADALTAGEVDSLVSGVYLLDVMLHNTAESAWHRSDPIYVRVIDGVTTAP